MPSTTSSPDSEVDTVESRERLCLLIGYSFAEPDLLDLALRHRSWCAENGGVASNERLEFLGDSVLGIVVTDHLYRSAPDVSEGVLARNRSELVSAVALAGLARQIDLGSALALGKGEASTGGRNKTSILADAMEAVIGAAYLDGGMEVASELVLRLLESRIAVVLGGGPGSDYKSQLQELVAHRFGELPVYEISDEGPEHDKHFHAVVGLGDTEWGQGVGRTKKEAEQQAALVAFTILQETQNQVDPRVGVDGGTIATGELRNSSNSRNDENSQELPVGEQSPTLAPGATPEGEHA